MVALFSTIAADLLDWAMQVIHEHPLLLLAVFAGLGASLMWLLHQQAKRSRKIKVHAKWVTESHNPLEFKIYYWYMAALKWLFLAVCVFLLIAHMRGGR